jgi:hypothetical protein
MKTDLTEKEIKYVGSNRYMQKKKRQLFIATILGLALSWVIGSIIPLIAEEPSPLYFVAIFPLMAIIIYILIITQKGYKYGKKFLEDTKKANMV